MSEHSSAYIRHKDNASREENKMNLLIFYPEAQLILCKDKQIKNTSQLLAPYFLHTDAKTLYKQ